MSASVRWSVTACQRVISRSRARRASSEIVWRGGGIAMAQPASRTTARRSARLLRGLVGALTATLRAPLRAGVLELLLDAVGGGVELERLLPGGDRVLVEAVLDVGVAEVLEDDRVFLGLLHGALQLPQRVRVLALLVV